MSDVLLRFDALLCFRGSSVLLCFPDPHVDFVAVQKSQGQATKTNTGLNFTDNVSDLTRS